MIIPLITYLLLFVVPLIVVPNIVLRFEPPKVLVSEVLIAFLCVYLIATGKFALKRVNKYLAVLVGCLFFLSLGHLLLSPTDQNLFGNVFRLQGTVLFWNFLVFALITQNAYFRLKEKSIFLCALIGLGIGSLVFGDNSAGRLIGSVGEPNALAAVSIVVFPFVFLSFKSLWVRMLSLIWIFAIINFTESRSALIALIIQLIFIGTVKLFRGKFLPGLIMSVILISLSLLLPVFDRAYFLQTNTDPYAFRFEDRAEIWQVAMLAGAKSPIIGSGIETIQGKINKTAQEINATSQYQVVDSSHNLLLDYWIWGGSIGLILLGILIIWTMINLSKKRLYIESVVLVGLLTVLMFNPTTVSVLLGFWWVIGRSFANPEVES